MGINSHAIHFLLRILDAKTNQMQRHLMYATTKSTGRVVKSTPNLRQREALPTFSCQLHAVFLKPYAVQF